MFANITMRGNIMKKNIIGVIAALASVTLLAGCAGTAATQQAQSVTTPTNFVEVSKSDGKFEFSSLSSGENKVDLKKVCEDLFVWATDNGYTRYTLIDNTFQLTDYENQGRPISNNKSDDSPFIAACGSNLERLTEKGENASPEGPNKNRIIVFFGKFGENKDVLGSVYLTAAFEKAKKYVKLLGEFVISETPSAPATNGDVPTDTPTEETKAEETATDKATETPASDK